jgi:regulator of CtrA degradation
LQDLIYRSMSLQTRVRRLDTTIYTPLSEHIVIGNLLVPHLNALKAAFER